MKEFTEYFNSFYNVYGLYPIKYTYQKQIKEAIKTLKCKNPKYKFEGDSVDRELIRDVIFTEKELIQAYK